jgi:hypothetical protein
MLRTGAILERPHDYSYYDYSPVFCNEYSSNLVVLVQSKLAPAWLLRRTD